VAEIKPVTPEDAQALVNDAGYVYIDVRTEPEFEQGHPPAALNVPLNHAGPGGMTPNPEFLEVMQAAFGKHEKLVVGCKSGARSRRAAELLARAGFSELADLVSGFEGGRDAFGRALPGWRPQGLPVETGKPAGQGYDDVKSRTPR
jgi:rhodanese-related sulfurtransferase